MYREEFLKEVLELYVLGVSVEDMAEWFSTSPNEINEIIDRYSPHLTN